jgi:polar amino acid transport system substrate-binding protein
LKKGEMVLRVFLILAVFVFLYSKEVKCVTTGTWAPFNVVIDGKLEGISIDYWNLIKKKLSINSTCEVKPTWSGVLDEIKNKKADLTISTTLTPDKVKYAIFSKPYAVFDISIATRNNIGYINSIDFLKGKKIAVGRDYSVVWLLKQYSDDFKIIQTKNVKEALKLVSEGKAFAAVDVLPVLVYNINKYTFANLKISGDTPWKFKIRFMLNKDNVKLREEIDKIIDTISPSIKKEIYRKWIKVNVEKKFDIKDFLGIIIAVIVVFLVLLFSLLFLLIRLKWLESARLKLEEMTFTDSLTQVFNKRKINIALEQYINIAKYKNTPLSVIFCDIDNFKKINDTYGHLEGDKVLREIGNLLKANLREYDLVGRWGGEEFLIILPMTNLEEAEFVAEKLRVKISKHPFSDNYSVTCSFGVTSFKKGDNLESLTKRADDLMYKAKKGGKNRVVVG